MHEAGMRTSVIMLTWNSSRHVRRALQALLMQPREVALEIVVVDNGSTDGTPRVVREFMPDAKIIQNAGNLGVARARNQGVKAASGKYILFLDADTEMAAGSLGGMVRFLEGHPSVGIVAPRLVSPDGSLQFSCRRFPTVPGKLLRQLPLWLRRALPLVAEEELHSIDRSVARPVDYVIGACQLIRKEMLDHIGLLDERMFYGPEDVDLCLRAWQAGWQVYYLPPAIVMHSEQRITRRQPGTLTLKHALALIYYFRKHRYFWRRPNPTKPFPHHGGGRMQ